MIENIRYYIYLFLILLLAEAVYYALAKTLKIGVDANYRSSHTGFQLTGGGIVFIIALIACVCFYPKLFGHHSVFIIGAILLAIVSFIDDIHNISPSFRLIVQIAVVGATFHQYLFNGNYDIFILIMLFGIGFVNAFNFMDGISGITGSYSIVALVSLYYSFSQHPAGGPYLTLTMTLVVAAIVFCIFNFQRRSMLFCGDVGAITMGFMLTYLMVNLIFITHDPTAITLFIVYGIDTSLTILQRIFKGDDIMQPHRLHLYQILVNQWGFSHAMVSTIYSATQFAINLAYFMIPTSYHWTYLISLAIILPTIYFVVKRSKQSQLGD